MIAARKLLSNILLALLSVGIVFCSGCYNQLELEDSIAPIGHGMDIDAQASKFIASAQFALPAQSDENTPKYIIRSAEGLSLEIAEHAIDMLLPRDPEWSFADPLIIGETLARTNVGYFLDHISRPSEIRETAQLFIALGCTPKDILKAQAPPEDTSGMALNKIIRAQRSNLIGYVPITVKEFVGKTAAPGIEPHMPQVIIEQADGEDRIRLSGIAVFKGDKMVGSLTESESRGFQFLNSSFRGGLLTVIPPGSNESKVSNAYTLEVLHSEPRTTVVQNGAKTAMNIKIAVDGNLYELPHGNSLVDMYLLNALEQHTNEAIRRDIMACISKLQTCQSDILGWGQTISRHDPALWKTLAGDWPANFAAIDYAIEVDFKLRRTYLIGEELREQ
jgi:spore germination protein KC